MSNQSFVSILNNIAPPAYAGTAYNTSTTLTDINPIPNYTIAAGAAQTSTTFRCTARLKFSNTSTPTLLLGIYWGGVAGVKLCAIGATTTTTAASNWPVEVHAIVKIRTIGTTGTNSTAFAYGFVDLATSLTAVTRIPMDASAAADVTIDTTVAKALTLGAQWGTNSASNTIQCLDWIVEQVC